MVDKTNKLTTEDVKRIANLAKLTLTQAEIKKFRVQLSQTLDFIERINEIPTEGVEPTSHVTGRENVFRKDEASPSLTQEEALSQAKSTINGFFRSPRVLK